MNSTIVKCIQLIAQFESCCRALSHRAGPRHHRMDRKTRVLAAAVLLASLAPASPQGIIDSNRIKEVYFSKLNHMIQEYIKTIDNIRAGVTSEDVRKSINTVKLLIQQTWIRTLKPGPAFIPLGNQENLDAVEQDIMTSLNNINKEMPVADAILTFARELDDKSMEEYRKSKNGLETSYQETYETLGKAIAADDEVTTQLLEETLRKEKEEMNVIDYVYEVQQIITKMYIQSYLVDFVEGPYSGKTITITSSKGDYSKEFPIPPMDSELYMEGFVNSWIYRRIREEIIPENNKHL